jgi:hypothetical protein
MRAAVRHDLCDIRLADIPLPWQQSGALLLSSHVVHGQAVVGVVQISDTHLSWLNRVDHPDRDQI